jgi:hypothetical protein
MDNTFLPNFFIIGAAKAGTTTLFDILNQYSQVYFPVQKEPSFFCDDEYYKNGVEWYSTTFYAKANHFKARGDATPRYLFWGGKVVPRMQNLYGDYLPLILAIFRDPVKLAYSYYWQNVREGREKLSFRDALAKESDRLAKYSSFLSYRGRITYLYSQIGSYASQLKPYLEVFPKEKFLFLVTDDFQNFSQLTEELEMFLNLNHKDWPKPVVSNRARLPRNPALHQWFLRRSKTKELLKKFLPSYELRHRLKTMMIDINLKAINYPSLEPDIASRLRQQYKPEVQKLEKIIDRDLSDWYLDS